MSVSMEATQKIEKCKISTTEKAETKKIFNEPELTCSNIHLIHFAYYIFWVVSMETEFTLRNLHKPGKYTKLRPAIVQNT